jgi:hypothetical protein
MSCPGQPIAAGSSPNPPLGYQQLDATALSASVGFTLPAGAKVAVVVSEAADVRWRDDGTDPTASVGMYLAAKTYFAFAANLKKVRFIAVSGSPLLNISYY